MTDMSTPEGTMCHECRIHLATVNWASDVMSWVHGFGRQLCKCCQLKRDLATAEKWATQVSKLRDELARTVCSIGARRLTYVHMLPEMNEGGPGGGLTACCAKYLEDVITLGDTVTKDEREMTCNC